MDSINLRFNHNEINIDNLNDFIISELKNYKKICIDIYFDNNKQKFYLCIDKLSEAVIYHYKISNENEFKIINDYNKFKPMNYYDLLIELNYGLKIDNNDKIKEILLTLHKVISFLEKEELMLNII